MGVVRTSCRVQTICPVLVLASVNSIYATCSFVILLSKTISSCSIISYYLYHVSYRGVAPISSACHRNCTGDGQSESSTYLISGSLVRRATLISPDLDYTIRVALPTLVSATMPYSMDEHTWLNLPWWDLRRLQPLYQPSAQYKYW